MIYHLPSTDADMVCVDDVFGSYILDSRPSAEFSYEAAINKLANLEVGSSAETRFSYTTPADEFGAHAPHGADQDDESRQGRLIMLEGMLDLNSHYSVCPLLR